MYRLLSIRHCLLLALFLLSAAPALPQQADILRAEEAFRYVVADTGDALEIDWAIADGYYLYRNKLDFASDTPGITFGRVALPEGRHHEDEFFGVQQVYRERFWVTIPYSVDGARPDTLQLIVKSQGCADLGICYPPQSWTTDVKLAASPGPAKRDLATFGSPGGANAEFLPVDEAFRPFLEAIDGNTVELAFQVAPGYYLYKEKIAVRSASDRVQFGNIDLPQGEMKTDEFFGDMEVYHNDIVGRVPDR
ncbi:MAG TPA: protein-disulfide reductase DsbD domain-containing protein, partial [Woeseiaceae bacterium]